MRAIGKFKGKSGVSMVLALVVMMAVSILCVSALKISSSAPQTAYAQQDFEQSYLSAASAAKLVKSILTDPTSAKAVEILGALDTATEKTFALQLNASGANTSTVNLPVMQVTLKKVFNATTEEASVDISFSEGAQTGWTVQTLSATTSAAPVRLSSISLSIKTDVDIWRDGAGAIVLAKLYPRSYTGALVDPPASISSRPDYAPDVYTHTYKEASNDNTSKIKWTVIWLDGDGTELERATYLDGEQEPQRKTSTTPTKAGDDRWWSYQPFANQWTSTTKGSVKTYTPQFTGAVRKYYVTWLDAAGAPIAGATNTLNNSDGTDPAFPGTNPTKDETDVYSYTFDNWLWDGKYGDTGSIFTKTYTPNFTATAKQYTAIWLNANGTELERQEYTLENGNVKPTTPPSKSPATEDDKYSYTFNNPVVWTVQSDDGVTTTYAPTVLTQNKKTYTVQWLDVDNTTLDTQTYVPADSQQEPTTTTKTPKAMDDNYFYTFGASLWKEPTVSADGLTKTYTPNITATTARKTRTVIWRGGTDNESAYCQTTDKETSPGVYPEIQYPSTREGPAPAKTGNTFVEYHFVESADWTQDWTKEELETTTSDGVTVYYRYNFTETPLCSQVIWYDSDGNVLDREEIDSDHLTNYADSWTSHAPPTTPDVYQNYTFNWHMAGDTTINNIRVVKYTPQYTQPTPEGGGEGG